MNDNRFQSESEPTLDELQNDKERLLAELEVERAKAELNVLKMSPLMESYGERVPQSEYPQNDQGGMRPIHQFSSVSDRLEGRYRPVYETAQDLNRIRAQARNLSSFASVACSAKQCLANYTIGTGFTFQVAPGPDIPKADRKSESVSRMIEGVQRKVDRFLEHNDFLGSLDRDIHDRSREDGEVFIAVYDIDGRATAKILEPEQIKEPDNPREVEDYLNFRHFVSYWKFGVHTQYSHVMQAEDLSSPLGYMVVFDQNGQNWDYIPASRMQHVKRNVSLNAKRGVSDYFVVQGTIEREAKLERNTALGAAAQAAITFIREHASGATHSQITKFADTQKTHDYNRPFENGSRNVRVADYTQPRVLDVPRGQEYKAGPLGSLRSPIYIEVAQYLMRKVGSRWHMPEYMISGDASNSNYSSSMVAESPFVKARISDQTFYKRNFVGLIWKALGLEIESGRWSAPSDIDALKMLVSIKVDAPEVASRERLQWAQANEIENRNGIKSKKTWAAEADLVYEIERENMDDEPSELPAGPQAGALQGAIADIESVEEIREIVESL